MIITDDIRRALTAGRLAHFTTVNPDGSPQVSVVWIGLDGDDIVIGHLLGAGRKVTNIARDPRVALTVEVAGANPVGLAHSSSCTASYTSRPNASAASGPGAPQRNSDASWHSLVNFIGARIVCAARIASTRRSASIVSLARAQ